MIDNMDSNSLDENFSALRLLLTCILKDTVLLKCVYTIVTIGSVRLN